MSPSFSYLSFGQRGMRRSISKKEGCLQPLLLKCDQKVRFTEIHVVGRPAVTGWRIRDVHIIGNSFDLDTGDPVAVRTY